MSVIVDLNIEFKNGAVGLKQFGAFDADAGFDMVDVLVREANRDGSVLRHRVSVTEDKAQLYVPQMLKGTA
jgi:hypothetical protein